MWNLFPDLKALKESPERKKVEQLGPDDKHFIFQILEPPPGYQPIRTPSRKLTATPTPIGGSGFFIQVCDTDFLSCHPHYPFKMLERLYGLLIWYHLISVMWNLFKITLMLLLKYFTCDQLFSFYLLMQQEDRSAKLVEDQPPGNLPYLKPDDVQYFDKLLVSWKSPRL